MRTHVLPTIASGARTITHLTGLTKIVWPIDVRYMLPATHSVVLGGPRLDFSSPTNEPSNYNNEPNQAENDKTSLPRREESCGVCESRRFDQPETICRDGLTLPHYKEPL